MKVEAVINDVIMQSMKIQPIIVNFNNGKLRNEEARKVKCNIFYDEAKDKTVLGMATDQVVYKGYRPDPKDESVYTMLAIHNKRTGKVRLIQAERWNVVPVFNDISANYNETNDDKTALLNKQFGSKKVKRRTEQYERMKINIESVKDQLKETAENTEVVRSDLEIKISEQLPSNYAPPCNRDAILVEDVYNLHDIIPKDKLDILIGKVDEIANQDLNGKSRFYIQTLNLIENGSKKSEKLAMLEFICAVSRWLATNIRDAKRKKHEICSVDTEISDFVIDTYSMHTLSSRTRPMSVRDRAMMDCMVLSLIIHNFKLDVELFSEHMAARSSRKKLLDLARIVGAVPSKDNKDIIVLKVPLPSLPCLVKRPKKK